MEKIITKSDLIPNFNFIGEEGWHQEIRRILNNYEVPLPEPSSQKEINDCERRLDIKLPQSIKLFLIEFGAVDFDGLRIYSPSEIAPAESMWFANDMDDDDRQRLPNMIQIADAYDFYVLDIPSGQCCQCSHDPLGFEEYLPSFDDLIKVALIDLSWGYYGYPGDDIADMAEELIQELYGIR